LEGAHPFLTPHSPDLFILSVLPYSYSPKESCPHFAEYLNKSLPDPESQTALQQWFGYNLIYDNSLQKLVFLLGEGSNGKSVACKILRLLLGPDNVSSIPLEAFDPQRTFALASTYGKL